MPRKVLGIYRSSEKRAGIACGFYAGPRIRKGVFQAQALGIGFIETIEREGGAGEGKMRKRRWQRLRQKWKLRLRLLGRYISKNIPWHLVRPLRLAHLAHITSTANQDATT